VKKSFRPWFWLVTGLALFTGFLALITPIFPDWIEFLSGWDPDHHNGSVERLIVFGLLALTVLLVGLAAVEWRRTPAIARGGISR